MGYRLKFSKQALKDAKKLEACGLDKKADTISYLSQFQHSKG
ncbi:hypothetical protein [Anaerocellum diazotrophicum]|nr:hypothetical protein [Caldicellulosiruptor diazotrophicus]